MSAELYSELGVSQNASDAEIKAAYRKLARKLHPDVNPGDKSAEERFKKVTAAFDILSDPEKRKLYDEFGEDAIRLGFDADKARQYRQWAQQASQGGRPGGGFGGFNIEDLFGGGGRARRGGSSAGGGGFPWEDLFGFGFGGSRVQMRGSDTRSRISLTLEEVVSGVKRDLIFEHPQAPGGRKKLKVTIPPGVEDGQVIRLAGQGLPGAQGGPPGDLLLEVHVMEHNIFRREGRDLELDVPLTLRQALLGADVEIPAVGGTVKLKVPPGAQPETRMRLRGKGVPGVRGEPAGDMYAVLHVTLPKIDPNNADVQHALKVLEGTSEEQSARV